MDNKKNNSIGTPYDDVFKTLLEKCRQLIIPVINEVFGMDYGIDEEVLLLQNEFHYISGKGNSNRKIIDSGIQIRNKMYHIECQSNPDSLMEIRMIEYDFFVALSGVEKYENGHVIKFPESAVMYIRHNSNTPDKINIKLELPGGQEIEYYIPVVKVQNYNKEEIFDKNLLFFIPYYILRFENRLEDINSRQKELDAFKKEYQEIYNKLMELKQKKVIDINYLNNLVLLTGYLAFIVAGNAENIKREVEVMGGKVLRFDTDDIWEEAMEKGHAAGMKEGLQQGLQQGLKTGFEKGEFVKEIALVRIKLEKNKSAETIADELEEKISFIERIISVIREDETLTDEEIYQKIK